MSNSCYPLQFPGASNSVDRPRLDSVRQGHSLDMIRLNMNNGDVN